MSLDLDLREDLRDLSFLVDDERGTLNAHILSAIHGLLFPNTILVYDLFIWVRDEGKGEIIFILEFFVALFGVRAYTEHHGILTLDASQIIPKVACFFRAS